MVSTTISFLPIIKKISVAYTPISKTTKKLILTQKSL